MRRLSLKSTDFGVDPKLPLESTRRMRGETMKDKSKKSTYSTTFGVDPILNGAGGGGRTHNLKLGNIQSS